MPLALFKTVRCKSDAGRTGGTSLDVVPDTFASCKEGSEFTSKEDRWWTFPEQQEDFELKFLTSPSTIFPEAERVVIEKTRAMEARKRTKCRE
ncbi:hypothetical protein GN244_ATG16504 [Phytophthora infestans]|uniref:Uncharacterized protein n=1 Tax=Phytophthora infestans TaxID=4787 RepID=A0A833W6C8_PHYIN|nr:hypothetical protein GN244_ATG16504 [Phytophthora infestans]